MRCVLCSSRKAKRYCPAKGEQICPQCCGEKRILVIDCPESCPYLQTGRTHGFAVEHARHLWNPDPAKQQLHLRVLRQFEHEVLLMEYTIAQERRSSRDLNDGELAEALDLLLKTLRTEEKGILYDHQSSNLRVEGLRRRLGDVVGSFRSPEDGARARLTLSDCIACLELIRNVLSSHLASSSGSYVDFLAKNMPRDEELGRGGSPLIVPG